MIGSLDLVCLLGIWMKFLPSTFCLASALGLPGGIPKCMKIPTCFQDPQKSEKVSPRPQADSKMTPKTVPPDTELVNEWTKWNHLKTTVFFMQISLYLSLSLSLSLYIYIYIYISAGPCLSGATRLRRHVGSSYQVIKLSSQL